MDFCGSVCNVHEQIAIHYHFCFWFQFVSRKQEKWFEIKKHYENENRILFCEHLYFPIKLCSFLQIRIMGNWADGMGFLIGYWLTLILIWNVRKDQKSRIDKSTSRRETDLLPGGHNSWTDWSDGEVVLFANDANISCGIISLVSSISGNIK